MPQSMEIQYSRANIKGDMSNFMKNSEHFISNLVILKLSRNVLFCSIWNVNRTFFTSNLGPYLLFGYHGNPHSDNF